MNDITKSPLTWPHWLPRTPAEGRTHARFGKKSTRSYGVDRITIAQATQRVLQQISTYTRVGQKYRADLDDVIISTNLKLRMDGLPMSNQRDPDDPGVAVYFTLDGKSRCIPCDSYDRVADNLAAVAATLEALRTIERHGSNMFEAAFTGFTGLPSPDQVTATTWRDILGYYGNNLHEAKVSYRRAASKAHTDNGGNDDDFHRVQVAWQQAQQALTT